MSQTTFKLSAEKREYYAKQKSDTKNYESIQQAFLLALLNDTFGFEIEMPAKLATTTLNMPKLRNLYYGKEVIQVKRLSEQIHLKSYIFDINSGIKEITAGRAFERKKRCFINNLLIDYASMIGYSFESKFSRKTKHGLQIERITAVSKDGKVVFNKNDIEKRGRLISNYMFFLVSSQESVKLDCGNLTLAKYLTSTHSNLMTIKMA
ncbi:hypothetical protein EIN_485920 [Entamoeba invadens IP1]|uniref:Uncharacterized protein n=1 Tax=Entamoeba invadens IP1 TaxID=370355 RepID=A0A0A1U7Z9_ENTIV|nr:hypothetical protein EIN_485920 [Entamoeba invadens IP1]ELP89190.1 hypothetical protein EIN_485920 [Entamoeba invadens IP1]|eukprot:XP_004255961.1 hypothetical protein EIN_485920 [Entamoeba invadens IP1]